MKYHLVLLGMLAGLAACGGPRQPPAWMRPAEKPRDENYHGGSVALLMKYDANHDGTLTRDELIAGLKAEFAAHDPRQTGCLDADQVAEINQSRVDADQSTATPIVDWNQDGCVDYTEFSAAPYSVFDQLDRNQDGKLTPQEQGQRKKPDDASAAGADDQTEPKHPEPGEGGPRGGRGPGPGRDDPPGR